MARRFTVWAFQVALVCLLKDAEDESGYSNVATGEIEGTDKDGLDDTSSTAF